MKSFDAPGNGLASRWRNLALMLAGSIGLAVFAMPAAALSTAPAPATVPVPGSEASAVRFSPGVRDILKMLDAKVDLGVIKAYIRNSPIAYNPSAAEIIALKQRGVPDDILTAMLQHGAEARSAGAASAAPVYPYAQSPYSQSPAYDYDYGTALSDYGYDYGYPVYSYSYPYYNYWWSNYGYPWYGYWPYSYYPWIGGFGFFGRRHFDFDRRFGFRNRSFAFHGHGGFVGGSRSFPRSTAPYAPARSFGGSFAAHGAPYGVFRGGGFSRGGGGFSHGAGGFSHGFGGGHGGGHR